jgi:hypothetical protein
VRFFFFYNQSYQKRAPIKKFYGVCRLPEIPDMDDFTILGRAKPLNVGQGRF